MKQHIAQLRRLGGMGLLIMAGLGCRARTSPQPDELQLSVQNSSDFQVNVYAIPSAPTNRVRLGSVAPLTSSRLSLPQSALAAGGQLRLLVDPIGSATEWVSPTVNVSSDTRPCLRVMSDVDGSLSRSTLYTSIGDGSECR
jgi:hypothetical protein